MSLRQEREELRRQIEALLPPREGWIVLCKIAKGEFEPVSFGVGEEPEPQMLAKRGRATIFETLEDAKEYINITYSWASAEGHAWARKSDWVIVPVYRDPLPGITSEVPP
jgi:hypothetical protein